MDISEKVSVNKLIRSYKGSNSFILSLQKQLKGKYLGKEEFKGKPVKVFSDKQYDAAKSCLEI